MNAIVPARTPRSHRLRSRPLVRIVIVGHVDHGKSTLIGRLLYETNSLPDGKLEQLQGRGARRGMPFEWSFVLDALQTERDQNITIDTGQIRFRTRSRDFMLIDAPGHAEFLRNMITGAAQADAAILVIDATEGVRDQTRRHGYLLQLLGIRQIVVVINKMDRVAYDATRFREIETEITDYLKSLGLVAHGDHTRSRPATASGSPSTPTRSNGTGRPWSKPWTSSRPRADRARASAPLSGAGRISSTTAGFSPAVSRAAASRWVTRSSCCHPAPRRA